MLNETFKVGNGDYGSQPYGQLYYDVANVNQVSARISLLPWRRLPERKGTDELDERDVFDVLELQSKIGAHSLPPRIVLPATVVERVEVDM